MDILVEVMHSRYIRRAVAHDEVGKPLLITLFELAEDLSDRLRRRDVANDKTDAFDGRHLLEIDSNDPHVFNCTRAEEELPAEHLAPAARRRAQVNCATYAAEYVELFVDLEELEGRARAPAVLLRLAVIDVALVLGVLAHGGLAATRAHSRPDLFSWGSR